MYINYVYVAYNNNSLLGVFDNVQILNNTIEGCIQKNLLQINSVKIEKYVVNSFFKNTDCDISGNYNIINVNSDFSGNLILDVSKNIINQLDIEDKKREEILETLKNNKLKKLMDKKQAELEKSEEYIKIKQDKIDLVHKINELKVEQKKLKELKASYEYDLKLYNNLLKEKEKNSSFIIPELFESKYKIFKKLDETNNNNFESFKFEWDLIKPKNNYNLFTRTTYEDSFSNKENVPPVEMELEI